METSQTMCTVIAPRLEGDQPEQEDGEAHAHDLSFLLPSFLDVMVSVSTSPWIQRYEGPESGLDPTEGDNSRDRRSPVTGRATSTARFGRRLRVNENERGGFIFSSHPQEER